MLGCTDARRLGCRRPSVGVARQIDAQPELSSPIKSNLRPSLRKSNVRGRMLRRTMRNAGVNFNVAFAHAARFWRGYFGH